MSNICRICNNAENNRTFKVKEMYFGSGDEFDYFECSKCGCLQIKEYPGNLDKYYPENYRAFNTVRSKKPGLITGFLRKQKLSYVLRESHTPIGFLLSLIAKPGFENKMLPAGIKSTDSILDIGSGAGALLLNLRNKGFKDITGSDIFIKEDIIYDEHLRILKKSIYDLEGSYDFIMLNHAFEHMPYQDEVLQNLHRLIKPEKMVMIRIPVKSEYLWNRYGVNWGSLHAPNHFYLHTVDSLRMLAEKNGFKLEKVTFDSGIYQFYSSEQFLKGIPLVSENSYHINPGKSVFSKAEIRNFKRETKVLNRTGQGDCACFYLRPKF